MGKGNGTTRGSSSRAANGIRGRMNYSLPVGIGGPAILTDIDKQFRNISGLLTEKGYVSKEYDLGDGFMARVTVNSLPTGNNEATLGVYDDGDFIDSQRIVYNPVRQDEVMQTNEDLRDKIITVVVNQRK